MKKILRLWILPVIISAGFFVAVRPSFAQLVEGQSGLVEYLRSNSVEVGTEDINGYMQVYYVFDGNKKFITEANYTNANPRTENEYVVWQAQIDSGWRIFLYHIPTGLTTQLTQTGINVNPQIDNSRVIWEGQDEGVWQIYLFNGTSVKQLTKGDMSLNPDIEGDIIVYGRKDAVGWRGVAYSLTENKEVDIATGEKAKSPELNNGKIFLSGGNEEFPLMVGDLFILDLAPLVSDDLPTVTEQDIIEELEAPEATGSGDISI